MFSSYLKRKNNSVLPKRTNEEKSLFSSQVKTPSFLTPRTGTSKDNRFDNPLYLPSSTSSFPRFQAPSAAAPKAFEIRENVKNAYESVYKNGKSAKIFDDIDDKTIEDSLKLSKSAIDSNLRLGKINDSFLKSHPYYRDGLTMFYALSDNKKTKEANETRKLAYTEVKNEKISDNPYSPKSMYDKGVEKIRERNEKDKKSGAPYREEPEKMPDLLGDNLSLEDIDLSVKGVYDRMFLRDNYKKELAEYDAELEAAKEEGKRRQEWKTPAEGTPKDIIVEWQKPLTIRQEYLDEIYPDWLDEEGYYEKYDLKGLNGKISPLIQHYQQNKPQVRYYGKYCLPIEKKYVNRITQGFWGDFSHAGKNRGTEDNPNYGFDDDNYLGAIDLAAPKGVPVYSVLPGKVVYVAPNGTDCHRVTVETEINGEIYYLEYLHMDKKMVNDESELKMGTQIGVVGDIGSKGSEHLDFRIYKFKDGFSETFSDEKTKKFFDPFEFFDFDGEEKYNYINLYGVSNNDYH